MRDGLYDFHFIVLDRDHTGALVVRGNLVEGGDEKHAIRGQLSLAGSNIMASFDVERIGSDRGGATSGYALKMFGTGSETTFAVIGLAPLGLIVEFRGTWLSGLATED